MLTPTSIYRNGSSVHLAMAAKVPGLPTRPGECLQLARVEVEHALKLPSHDFYRCWPVHGTARRWDDSANRPRLGPWASDFERSMKLQGMAVPPHLRRGGDFTFNHSASEHVARLGILVFQWGGRQLTQYFDNDLISNPFVNFVCSHRREDLSLA